MMMKSSYLLLLLLGPLIWIKTATALDLAEVFTNHMVLQQQQIIPVWGNAEAGTKIRVRFAMQQHNTRADENGRWMVKLSPLQANFNPQQLIVEGDGKIIVEDILIGEVWLSSGQSNMRLSLAQSENSQLAIAQSVNNNLRLLDFTNKKFYPSKKVFNVKQLTNLTPDNYFKTKGWQRSSQISSKSFSAVAYYFSLQLQQELNVPVGIINVAVGGTLMENFISPAKLASIESLTKLNDNWLENIPQWCADRAKYNLKDWIKNFPDKDLPHHPFEPGFLFNAGISPLIPFAIKGVIWYQGESNAPIKPSANPYIGNYGVVLSKIKFKALISDWRERWQQPELPFLFVQLPGVNRPWSLFRQMQTDTFEQVSNTGMAVTYDLGEPTNVHPKNKKSVAARLALWALAKTYRQPVIFNGPVFDHTSTKDQQLSVFFNNITKDKYTQLSTLDDDKTVKGFEIAGSDGKFVKAVVAIVDDHLVLTSNKITRPIMVRYAWFDDPKGIANLANLAGLPASPFISNNARSKVKDMRGQKVKKNVTDRVYYQHKKDHFKSFQGSADVVMVGDSITDGAEWHEMFPTIAIVNRGISGDTTVGLLARIEGIAQTNASKAFVMIGVNDFSRKRSVDEVFNNYQVFISALQKLGITPYIQSTLQAGKSKVYHNQRISELNRKLKAYAQQHRITFIDLNKQLAPDGTLDKAYSLDQLHLNATGYQIWKSILKQYL